MKHLFRYVAKLFQGLVGKLFFVANFIICLVIFDWEKFVRYLETPARVNCHFKPYSGGGIDFCGYGGIEPFLFLFAVLFLILVGPSIVMAEIILGVLKGMFPLWCIETYDVLYVPVFALFNGFYWLFLGDMIEIAHTAYLEIKPAYKPLSVFPDSH